MLSTGFFAERLLMTKQVVSDDTQSSSKSARAQHHPKQWWLEHYHAWQGSGLTKGDYCSNHDIKLSSFYNWVCRFQKESVTTSQAKTRKASSSFVEVAVRESSPAEARSLTIGDITVGFDKGLSPVDVAQWVKSLRTISC